MPNSAPTQTSQRASWSLAIASCLAAAAGIAAIWAAVTVALHNTAGWMALLAALDVIGVLTLTGSTRGSARAALAGLATVLSLGLAWWFIAAAQMARTMGMHPFASLQRMGSTLALDLALASQGAVEIAFAIASVLLAIAWGRYGAPAWLSGRRRQP